MFKTKFDWYRVVLGITLATAITAVIYMVLFLTTKPTESYYEIYFQIALFFIVVALIFGFALWRIKRALNK